MNDKFTMIRSMSYTPNGLFNHTAAIYQMMTGYTTDKCQPVRPARAARRPRTSRTSARNIIRLKPTDRADAAVRHAAAAAAGINVVGKGGTAGFLGKGFDPYTLYPGRRRHGHGQDGPHQGRRPQAAARGLRRAPRSAAPSCATSSTTQMPDIEKAVAKDYNLDEYYDKRART